MKNKEMLESGSFGKLFMGLCLPTIIIMLVMVIYNMADIFFIGRLGDANMVAALSLCTPMFSILSGLGTLLGSGGCTAMSISLGRSTKDSEDELQNIRRQTAFCFYGSIAIGLLVGTVSLLGMDTLCRLFGATEDVVVYMRGYLTVLAIGAPIILFNNVFMNLIRADGSASASMVVNLLGTMVNIILDPILISGFSMGVAGAAIATVVGNAVSALYLLWYIRKKKEFFSLHLKDFTLRKEVSLKIISLGLPLAISTLMMSVSSIINNTMMIRYGATAVAAQGVAGKAGMLITMLIMGICMGLQPAISYNYGAGNAERVGKILIRATILTTIIGSILMGAGLLFRDSMLRAFLNDPDVIREGRLMMTASVLVGPIYGLYQISQTYLQSTGKASYATFVSLLDKGLFYIPVMLTMNAVFGLKGLIFSGLITSILSIAAGGILSVKWSRTPKLIAD